MDINIFIIVIALAFGGAAIGMLYIRQSHRRLMKNRTERRELIARSENLRLPKMLKALGIGMGQFFYKTRIDDLRDAIVMCENCPSADQCRQKTRMPELNPEDAQFCPNVKPLDSYSRARRIRK